MAKDICFEGIEAPLRIEGAEQVLELLPQIIARWPKKTKLRAVVVVVAKRKSPFE